MPLDGQLSTLNRVYKDKDAQDVLEHALNNFGDMALVSSFGAESVVLLHMAAQINPDVPVLFIDTEMLFAETLEYQRDVAAQLGLTDVRAIRAKRETLFEKDNENLLHLHDTDACCALRKTEPLQRALQGFDGWVSGRKRVQGGDRQALEYFEIERPLGRLPRAKVNPLAHWDRDDLQDYIKAHNLPRHPLVAKGYPSVGCSPCTTKVKTGEDARAGRWRDQSKTECGIHFGANGAVRAS
ncbi:phosphoadenylylsulfate reductase (thioredoxin) [Octadecabacter temperatus]|uniref:Adenosine 5'-phosphosulfate reductase n=1 Tax=Octadecabacter temperatus TaxID=1458307 RepID=A0A0K0Y4S5_9RHOB|nr:phosphoadenylyl-sulfate reductase [Octadecabacter temperatus]AKS45837.1 Phosphoadenosine phosphosulfate reductase [Octadecabacter temperatus]SIO01680.1 phosphoadenylylsulfate reductase (thioredoxin) [Octadecabacter temperatus]